MAGGGAGGCSRGLGLAGRTDPGWVGLLRVWQRRNRPLGAGGRWRAGCCWICRPGACETAATRALAALAPLELLPASASTLVWGWSGAGRRCPTGGGVVAATRRAPGGQSRQVRQRPISDGSARSAVCCCRPRIFSAGWAEQLLSRRDDGGRPLFPAFLAHISSPYSLVRLRRPSRRPPGPDTRAPSA